MLHPSHTFWKNPLFRHELARGRRRAWTAGLSVANAVYVWLFVMARILPGLAHEGAAGGAQTAHAAFNYAPWTLVGTLLLSLSAHWLVPTFLAGALSPSYELRLLNLMVRARLTDEQAFRSLVAARIAPLVFGAAPLLLVLPVLAMHGLDHLAPALAALGAALLWGALAAGVSLWTGASFSRVALGTVCAYVILSVVLPALIGLVAYGIGIGCSAGRPNRDFVFRAAAALTWSLLVTGCAACFWDAAIRRLFPERQRPLWQEAPVIRWEP